MDYETLELYAGYDDIDSFEIWLLSWDLNWDATG